MSDHLLGVKAGLWRALLVLALVCGCESDGEQSTRPEQPAQAPGVEGMKWLKEHGYVDQNGRPIAQDQRK